MIIEKIFKAWDSELGMSYEFNLGGFPMWPYKYNASGSISKPYWSKLCKILQYTGLTEHDLDLTDDESNSSDSKKIFEGDIVEVDFQGRREKAVIIFDNGAFLCEVLSLINMPISEFFYLAEEDNVKVIGNKTENPELLK